jgi:hypothetical protein
VTQKHGTWQLRIAKAVSIHILVVSIMTHAIWVANLTDFALSWHKSELYAYNISISDTRNKFAPSLNWTPPYERLRGELQTFLAWTLYGDIWVTSRSDRITNVKQLQFSTG